MSLVGRGASFINWGGNIDRARRSRGGRGDVHSAGHVRAPQPPLQRGGGFAAGVVASCTPTWFQTSSQAGWAFDGHKGCRDTQTHQLPYLGI